MCVCVCDSSCLFEAHALICDCYSQLLRALTVVVIIHTQLLLALTVICSHSMYGLILRILYVFINDPCLICTVPFCLLTFVIRNGPSHSIVPNLFSISFGPLCSKDNHLDDDYALGRLCNI